MKITQQISIQWQIAVSFNMIGMETNLRGVQYFRKFNNIVEREFVDIEEIISRKRS